MSDDLGNPEPLEAGQFLGSDGAFQEDWMSHFGDDDEILRTDPTLKNCKDVRSMAKMLVHSESRFGKDQITIPGENATDLERAEFNTKMDIPDDAAGYGLADMEFPEGIVKDEAFVSHMSDVLKGASTTKAGAAKIIEGYLEFGAKQAEAQAVEQKILDAKGAEDTHKVFGSAYDEKMASANYAIEALVRAIDPGYADTLKATIANDPVAAQIFASMGALVGEDPGLTTTTNVNFTPGDAMAKANEIMRDPYYMTSSPQDKQRDAGRHAQLVEQVAQLIKIANPGKADSTAVQRG